MTTLLSRLQSAEEGSRELDVWLHAVLFQGEFAHRGNRIRFNDGPWYWLPDEDIVPHYTTNLQDAVDLVKRVLPGWHWHAGTLVVPQAPARPYGGFVGEYKFRPTESRGDGPTPALALCCALLAAIEGKGK